MHCFLLRSLLVELDGSSQSMTAERTWPFQIPLVDDNGVWWGEGDRTADHATVAINDDGDILVAYHATRTDIDNIPGKPAFHEPLKQVEIALFRYDSTNDEWDLVQQELIGSTEHNPLNSTEQDNVRCERPDVIAVDNRFFVVWTRRYDRNMNGWEEEPAILECAWVRWNDTTSSFDILNNSVGDGRGFELDRTHTIRECSGVPDAVQLHPGGGGTDPTVGVLYPHQTDFGDSIGGNDQERRCDLRLVTVSINSSNQIPTPDAPVTLVGNIPFHGPTAPPGQVAEGFILPDCARAQGTFRFWLACEDQREPDTGNVPDGRIHLQLWEYSSSEWSAAVSITIGTAASPHVLRRPMLSSCPEEAAGGLDRVSLTFSQTDDGDDMDVVHDEWVINSLGFSKLVGPHFENDGDSHNRPTILHGRDDPMTRRLYVGEAGDPTELLEYDIDGESETVKRSADALSRPAVAYRPGSPDDFVLTWEEQEESETWFRIWLRVD